MIPTNSPSILIGEKPYIDFSYKYNKPQSTKLASDMLSYWMDKYGVMILKEPSFKGQIIFIQDYQPKVVSECLSLILRQLDASQILAGTGTGKTYIYSSLMSILIEFGYLEYHKQAFAHQSPFPFAVFTPAGAVLEQTKEAIQLYPHLKNNAFVYNYEQLRCKLSGKNLGALFIEWKTVSSNGGQDIHIEPVWNKILAPILCVFDENQKLKNTGTLQTKACSSYNDLRHVYRIQQVFASATPFTRPSESKVVASALQPPYIIFDDGSYDSTGGRVKSANWQGWIDDIICGPRIKPEEYSPAAMERLTNHLMADDQLIQVSNVKFPHRSFNRHMLIDFQTYAERMRYQAAYEKMLKKILEGGGNTPQGMGEIFAELVAYQMEAEDIRHKHLANLGFLQEKSGSSVIIATKFKATQDHIYNELTEVLGFSPDKVAFINGKQSKKERWANVNKFQDDKATIMLLMMQAGGTGLSLHNYKPRNTRPRDVFMPPVWSIIEMLQVLGRCVRINMASTVTQHIVWYKGTVEASVVERLKEKALSSRELMKRKEQWSDLFTQEVNKSSVDLKKIYELKHNESLMLENSKDDEDESKDEFWNTDENLIADNTITL